VRLILKRVNLENILGNDINGPFEFLIEGVAFVQYAASFQLAVQVFSSTQLHHYVVLESIMQYT
jgi:hypothetical protein